MNQTQFDQPKCKVGESKMVRKLQLLIMILAIFISVGYGRGPKKVIKGEDASIIEIPHQVSLQKVDGFHFCGGSIIDPQLILTAAHCIVDEEGNPTRDNIYVLVGTRDNKLITAYNRALVIRRVHHNWHNGYYSKNDIAILKVNRPIFFGIFVAPAKLPRKDVPAGTIVVASGWGATKYNNRTGQSGNYARFLQKHYGTVITQKKCQIAMENKHAIGPEHICVETPNGADTCQGDSGGPLTYNGEVIGIVSFGFGCGLDYPAVFTRVHHYLQWIRVVKWAMYFNTQLPYSPNFVET